MRSIADLRSLALAPLVALMACGGAATEEGTTEEAAPAVDQAAVEEQIAAAGDAWEQAALAGDATALAALYAEDAILLPPGLPRAVGRAEIEAAFGAMFSDAGLTSVVLDTDRVVVSGAGDLAVEVGTYRMEGAAPDGTTWVDSGKYSAGLRNEGGTWRIVADTWNADGTPPAAGETAPEEDEAAAE